MTHSVPSAVPLPTRSPRTHPTLARTASALRLMALLMATALVLGGIVAIALIAALNQTRWQQPLDAHLADA